ncbi:hypothetical protein E8E13_011346 [Curvularia kusanoi]|uniref:Protein kinase domain-containing protein n=1 Tax=Curvularia kusanoi TaxID=90978 RepID=A0A9P4TP51_CURKU|nr:hypothetical protein E8E13_011346 [Curvularia kusanoi]
MSPQVPKEFFRVRDAGGGGTSEVHLCLPVQQVKAFISRKETETTTASRNLLTLRSSLVAVKVADNSDDYTQKIFNTEYNALQAIKDSKPEDDSIHERFPRILYKGMMDKQDPSTGVTDSFDYLVLEAYNPPLSLRDIIAFPCIEVPVSLVYHVFLSLGSAVLYLRDKVRLSHGDIVSSNVIVCPCAGTTSGLPLVALIDFGRAEPLGKYWSSSDCCEVIQTVQVLLDVAKVRDDETWEEFTDMVRKEINKIAFEAENGFSGLWLLWKAIVENLDMGVEMDEITEVLWQVVKDEDMGVSDADLINAVEEHMG